ncbi:hypothetical protein [Tateyamaria sp.]|uniref:hypothetical protein n=1 Tax=Tateyamaria sp. TaxID=1929288 RepID=UPI003B21CC6E
MALQQAVGMAAGVSTTLPATFDSTGFAALTYTACGRLNTAPDLDGEYDVANFDDLTLGTEVKLSDVFRAGEGTMSLGFDEEDAGQAILEGAKGDKVALAFTLKNGTVYYRTAIIKSYKPVNISTGNIVMADVMLAFEGVTVKKVKVAAAPATK